MFTASTADATTSPWYLDQNVPSTQAGATDHLGRGGFSNLPPGPVVVQAFKDGVVFAEDAAPVHAGEITWFGLSPRPSQ